jgi:hypothetical protein
VLPVRVRGRNAAGLVFEALAHTLDLNPTGARLGALRHKLEASDILVVVYRQRRIEFTVVWSKLLEGCEYQVGLQTLAQQGDPWGLAPSTSLVQPALKTSAVSLAGAA